MRFILLVENPFLMLYGSIIDIRETFPPPYFDPVQVISTLQLWPPFSTRGQRSVIQLPWWLRSKPASEPVTVSTEKRQSVAASLREKPTSCPSQLLPMWKSLTWGTSPILSK